MAKVVAPLGSFSASGKIGKALVFMTHLGRNVVRGLVTPQNPQTETQGNSRVLLGALGRAGRLFKNVSLGTTDLKTVVPSGQTVPSAFIKDIINTYGSGATGVAALNAAFTGHTNDADFTSAATTLGLTDLVISYAAGATDTITKGAMLYAAAVHCFNVKGANPDLFDRAPYTTALASWDSTEIADFITDLVG